MARRGGRIVRRPDDPAFGLQDREDFAAPIDVVAHRDAVDAGGQQFVVDFRRQARAAGGVLGIGHHQIEVLLARSPRMACVQMCRPGLPTMSPMKRIRMGGIRDWGLGIRN